MSEEKKEPETVSLPTIRPKKKRGALSYMSAERRREIARMGGLAAQKTGRCHRWTKEEAAAAGKKGGSAAQKTGKAHRFNKDTARSAKKKSS